MIISRWRPILYSMLMVAFLVMAALGPPGTYAATKQGDQPSVATAASHIVQAAAPAIQPGGLTNLQAYRSRSGITLSENHLTPTMVGRLPERTSRADSKHTVLVANTIARSSPIKTAGGTKRVG